MPRLTVEDVGTFDVAERQRLVLAIEQQGVDILHAYGGNARCTTCRVEFIDGEPTTMTRAEKERLEQRGLTGVRLSCQIVCDHDMHVRAISRLEGSGRADAGPPPDGGGECTPATCVAGPCETASCVAGTCERALRGRIGPVRARSGLAQPGLVRRLDC